MFKNVIIKISGEALQGESPDGCGQSFDDKTVSRIVDDIIELKNRGVYVSLVIGGGNFWRGRSSKESMDRAKSDQIGMLATVMNGIYLSEEFNARGAKAVVMTPFAVGGFTELFRKEVATAYLEKGTVVIFAGGSGLPFFSTDTITAIRGAEVGVDALLFAKNVNGIYDSDPNKNPNAKKYHRLTFEEYIKNNLQAVDISAMSICMDRGMDSVLFGLNEPKGIIRAVLGTESDLREIGTIITNN